MRATLAAAGVEIALVALWIASFVQAGDMGTPHQPWYVELPLLFLVFPIGVIAAALKIGRSSDGWRFGAYLVMACLLAANLAAFCLYGAVSGGGV